MKQLPHISGLLYGTPWAILPETHAELGMRGVATGGGGMRKRAGTVC